MVLSSLNSDRRREAPEGGAITNWRPPTPTGTPERRKEERQPYSLES
jgi:hypothetical protein